MTMRQTRGAIALLAMVLASPAAAATFETLFSFNQTSGAFPSSGVVADAAGNLFGTTTYGPGGVFGLGTVYRFGTDGSMTLLHNFTNGADGSSPTAGLIADATGKFYGTTGVGGANDRGTIFRIDSSGNLSTLRDLELSTGIGVADAMIIDNAGNLIGVAPGGGTGPAAGGTVFRYGIDGAFTVLHNFDNYFAVGIPIGSPVLDPFGNLYGTTVYGGSGGGFGNGTIFRLGADGAFSIVHAFDGVNGFYPYGALVSDADGNIFGTTTQGGSGSGGGTIFRLGFDGAFSVLHAFDTAAGGTSPRGLIIDAAGNLFGGTTGGGALGDYGTIFRLGTDGVFTTLHDFAGGSGGRRPSPYGTLAADAVGNLYGTTVQGGDFDYGTIFRLRNVGFVLPSIDPPGGGGVIPEPATWAMLIAGFGLVGGAMRRRRLTNVAA
jgi:uncharacterized repeat protein (TIGR03803 family)